MKYLLPLTLLFCTLVLLAPSLEASRKNEKSVGAGGFTTQVIPNFSPGSNNNFTGTNSFTATNTFATATFSGFVGINSSTPHASFVVNGSSTFVGTCFSDGTSFHIPTFTSATSAPTWATSTSC